MTDIPQGAIYSAAEHKRHPVDLTPELRGKVKEALTEMRQCFDRGYTPKVRKKPGCKSCSMREVCQIDLLRGGSAREYVARRLAEEDGPCDGC